MSLRKIGNACGLVAPVAWGAAIMYVGSLRPEYSHMTQYISELGERGSTTELLMRYPGFVSTGLMHVGFAACLSVVFAGSRAVRPAATLIAMDGVARVVAGMFPCELGCAGPRVLLSQKLHTLSAGVGFFSMIAAAIVWGVLLRRYRPFASLSAYSVISGVLALVFLALMSWSSESRAGTGLYELLSTGTLSVWMFVFAVRLWRLRAYDTIFVPQEVQP